jgi:hypothetical protein
MSAWKQFLASDIIVNPFVVNKSFSFPESQWATGSNGQLVGIDRFLGANVNWFEDQSTTGTLTTEYQALIYNSAKQLYYSNFLSSSTGDIVAQPVIFPGAGPSGSGDVLIGGVESPIYDNFLQSTLVPTRFWPTASNANILVLSIPSKLYGEYIVPNSFNWYCGVGGVEGAIVDDGQGNLLSGSTNIGNIIYTHGLVILTTQGQIYNEDLSFWSQETNMTCSFSSSMTIYETQYKCTIRESEFNATLNPTARDLEGNLNDNVTGSFFSPYVTTVGLYDELQNLLAVGKLSQPLPTSDTTDTTILINLDR